MSSYLVLKDKGIGPDIFHIKPRVQYIRNHTLQIIFQLIFFSGKYRRFMKIFSYAVSQQRSSSQLFYSCKQPQGFITADFPPPAKYIAFVYFIICVLFMRRFSSSAFISKDKLQSTVIHSVGMNGFRHFVQI